MAEETRKEQEERLQREYEAYVAQCKADGVEFIGYMNWAHSQKIKAEDYVGS